MNKEGIINVFFTFMGLAMIIFITMIYMLYFQIGVIKNSVKEELYYALMNGQVSLNKEELAFGNYIIDKGKLENILDLWIKETAKSKVNVNEIEIIKLLTNRNNSSITLQIELKVSFTPIMKLRDKATIKLNDEIDLSLLKLK